MPDPKPTTREKFGAAILTLFGVCLVAGSVWAAMAFVTIRLGVPSGYWLVPISGALGGIVLGRGGGILRCVEPLRPEGRRFLDYA